VLQRLLGDGHCRHRNPRPGARPVTLSRP
jgi:hypothetical protein